MTTAYLLGIDAGTSVIKSVLFTLDGREVASAAQSTTILHPQPTWAEQDMDAVWQAVVTTVRQVIGESGAPPTAIRAIGLTGQGDGTWLVDREHRPVRPAIIWLDGRVADDVRQCQQDGLSAAIFQITGTVLNTSNQALHLRWLQKNEPETLVKASAALRAKDWIFLQMTGQVSTDETDASYTYFSTQTQAYAEPIFQLLDIATWRHLIPLARPAYMNQAELQPTVAAALGLPSGLPVVCGPFDVAATDLGAGVLMPGDACTILGTAGIHQLVMAEPNAAPENIGYTMRHAPPNRFVRLLPTMTGTLNLQWFVEKFYSHEKAAADQAKRNFWDELEQLAAAVPLGADGVLYHPYIDPAGERAPFVRPEARAQFTGIHVHHGREHLLRAVYQGVALSALDCYNRLPTPVTALKLAGGGARSPFWSQMFADALGCPVSIVEGQEFGAKGAALNAGVAIGLYPSYEQAVAQTVRPARTYEPALAKTKLYHELLTLYRNTYTAMFPIWAQQEALLR
ncbi:MAG: FGGY-family carbohydrate kinase [Caldilineaceae bacterium]